MKLYSGIDLHSNNNYTVVMDPQDRVMYRKRLPNMVSQVVAELKPFQAELAGVVVESTYNWYWLVDGLMEAGYRVHLANTTAIQQYSGLKYSDDFSDAQWLARMLRLGVLPEGYIYPKESRRCGTFCGSVAGWSASIPATCYMWATSSPAIKGSDSAALG